MRRSLLRLPAALWLFAFMPAAPAAEIRLDQADGTALTLPAPARSLVSLSPHLTELVFAAGAGGRLVATVEYSEFPAAAKSIPRVGDAFRLDIERIVALDADLVIAWESGNPQPALRRLRSMGVPVWSVEIRDPGEIADALMAIGMAAGHPESARRLAQSIRDRLDGLARDYDGAETLDYFYQVDARPLFTINGEHLISKGLALCGGRNVFEAESGLAFQVGIEAVLAANPEALLAPGLGGDDDPLAVWRQWPAMRAVRNEALFLLPADSISRATPRFLDSLELACTLLHRLRERDDDG